MRQEIATLRACPFHNALCQNTPTMPARAVCKKFHRNWTLVFSSRHSTFAASLESFHCKHLVLLVTDFRRSLK